jgi:HAMP domain-containing protein
LTPRIRWRGLRLKIVAWAFVPIAITLVAVGLVSFYAFQSTTRHLLIERNRELIRLTAGQVAVELAGYANILSDLTRSSLLPGLSPEDQQSILQQTSKPLAVFDGGVVVTDEHGVVVASEPERQEIHGQDWSNQNFFREMVRAREPVYSLHTGNGSGEEKSIIVAVPILGPGDAFLGMVAGRFRMGSVYASPFYANIVKLRIGEADYSHLNTFIVDSDGLVIYHSDGQWIGTDFSAEEAVRNLLTGNFVDDFSEQTSRLAGFRGNGGAVRFRNIEGRDVIAYFSTIPGTKWGLVSEYSWAGLLSVYQNYLIAQALLFILGVLLPAIIVRYGIRRITEPIYRLMSAAREVARGNFGQEIRMHTGDELEELVDQFNRMSRQLSQSYETLEQRVDERTRDLATLNSISALTNRSLELKEILPSALEKTMEVMRMEFGIAYRLEGEQENEWISPDEAAAVGREHLFLHALVYRGFSEPFVRFVERLPLTDDRLKSVIDTETPRVWNVRTSPVYPALQEAALNEAVEQVIFIPLKVKGRLVGAMQLGTRQPREITDEELDLLGAVGQQVGIAAENARLHQAVQRTVTLEERATRARELHD